jgi:hypothetical protein
MVVFAKPESVERIICDEAAKVDRGKPNKFHYRTNANQFISQLSQRQTQSCDIGARYCYQKSALNPDFHESLRVKVPIRKNANIHGKRSSSTIF